MAELTAINFSPVEEPRFGELSIRVVTGATTPSHSAVDAVRDYTVEFAFDPQNELQSLVRSLRFFSAKLETISDLDPDVGRRIAHRMGLLAYRSLRRVGRGHGVSVSAELQITRAAEKDEQAPAAKAMILGGYIVFNHGGGGGGDRSGERCSVCLEGFEREKGITHLPLCLHKFHSECIAKWLRRKRTCPICRGRA